MAQLIGLIEDAHSGEAIVAKALASNLPKEFMVYYEPAIHFKRDTRYPDFVVVTDYGVVILEVKNWYSYESADAFHITLSKWGDQKEKEKNNPIRQVKDYGDRLRESLRQKLPPSLSNPYPDIPFGYAVVLPAMDIYQVSRLKQAWGEHRTLSLADLDANYAKISLKNTISSERIQPLHGELIKYIRSTINPNVNITSDRSPTIILSPAQEQLVMESPKPKLETSGDSSISTQLNFLFPEANNQNELDEPREIKLVTNTNIRLIRGIAGSGKTLVLTQRARYLSNLYPDWAIQVVTFNRNLSQHLRNALVGTTIKADDFHQLCMDLINHHQKTSVADNLKGYLRRELNNYPFLSEYLPDDLTAEIKWIKEMGFTREAYLAAERKGRGKLRLTNSARGHIMTLVEEYTESQRKNHLIDWEDVPFLVLSYLDQGKIKSPQFDALLIDEAQDFAPVWLEVLKRFITPEGILFMADDPSQSIYRFYSWREKGMEVVGRTRWLNIPYRNTRQIYKAAYQLILHDDHLKAALEKEGGLMEPDFDHPDMRTGSLPLLTRYQTIDNEATVIRSKVSFYIQNGIRPSQIAVLSPRKNDSERLAKLLKLNDICTGTFHAYKGLEFDVVFLCGIDHLLDGATTPEDASNARRLLYMSMTRARQELLMSYYVRLPEPFNCLRPFIEITQ